MQKRRIFLALSFTAWIATSSFADPQTLLDAPAVSTLATTFSPSESVTQLDTYTQQMWAAQEQMVSSLSDSGLIAADAQHDHYHDHGNGMGGEYGGELSVLSENDSDDDGIQQQIEQISRDAQARQNGLDARSRSRVLSHSSAFSDDVIELNNSSLSNLNIGAILAIEPVANARVSSGFGYRHLFGKTGYHPGVDLAAPTGTPIYATGDGVVVRAGWVNGYGNFVEIDHGNGLLTRYGHASRILVSVGDQVKANQNIAAVGCTGRCTGPHLHYEVLRDGQRENPATYLALAPKRDF